MKNIKNIIEQKYPPENPNDLWMKDDVLYKSTHKGWTPLTAGGGSSTNGVTSTTWLELKDKRDAGKLTPGSLYRITDYQCTTTQENTRSAGHQFDIVLLALSENKLAEEGWAMEHPTDVYDVTFRDGITKKCYLYVKANDDVYLVKLDDMLGYEGFGVADFDEINQIEKTATVTMFDSDGGSENIPYNYFQNSNLSAWKVWYCLDNDTARFAWADDSVDEGTPSQISIRWGGGGGSPILHATCIRNSQYDTVVSDINYYCFKADGYPNKVYTRTETPSVNDSVFEISGGGIPPTEFGTVESYTPSQQGTGPNGRGVIYRLIDEWGNDVGYDFKNIQFVRKLTDGKYDPEGEDTWVYTIFRYNYGSSTEDASIATLDDHALINNKIDTTSDLIYGTADTMLPNNVITNASNIKCSGSIDNTLICDSSEVIHCMGIVANNSYSIYLMCNDATFDLDDPAIYINNKKVLTEE